MSRIAKGNVGVVGLDHAGEQRECAVVEFHRHALECLEGRGDLEHLQDDRLIGTKQLTTSNAEAQLVTDLTGSAGNNNSCGGLRHVFSSLSNKMRLSGHQPPQYL